MDSRNDLIDGDRVHARVVDARRKPVVVDVHARAAGEPCGDRLTVWPERTENEGRLGAKKDDAVYVRQRSEVPLAAIIGDQHIGKRVEHEYLAQGRAARETGCA